MDFLKGYRTVVFNIAVILAGLAELVGVINVVAPGSEALVLLIVGIANVVLRYLTDTPVGVSIVEETEE
jgi:hypothetical protein